MTLAQELEKRLPVGEQRRFGELTLSRSESGSFSACHVDDAAIEDSLRQIDEISELREIARFDPNGNHRPLKTAPTLQQGWKITSGTSEDFLRKLDTIYPALFATWISYDNEEQEPVSLDKTLERQTGIYDIAGAMTDQIANEIMRSTCSAGCIRKIAWPLNNHCAVSRLKAHPKEIPAICTEACVIALDAARELIAKSKA